jgi:hypothetical protein
MGKQDSTSKSAPERGDKQSSKVTSNPDLGGSAQGDGASSSGKSASSTDRSSTSDRSTKNSGGSTSSRDGATQRGGSG